jgi:hypothetical protein
MASLQYGCHYRQRFDDRGWVAVALSLRNGHCPCRYYATYYGLHTRETTPVALGVPSHFAISIKALIPSVLLVLYSQYSFCNVEPPKLRNDTDSQSARLRFQRQTIERVS